MTSPTTVLTYAEIEALAAKALTSSDVSPANAGPVARSIAAAERDGQAIVGLSYLPIYCDHAACGKVDGHATPRLETLSPAAIRVDAMTGFAHPAIALGMRELVTAARQSGLAALSVGNSYACGSLGFFVEELADKGLVALMAANASPSIAPFGGKTPFFGTNPLAFAAPRKGRAPLVIDQSSSVVAKVAVIDANNTGAPLPDGWAIDSDGVPTNDAAAAMQGSLLPIGGYKGFGLALMVDILAAGLTRSHWSFEASSFGDCEGGPPKDRSVHHRARPRIVRRRGVRRASGEDAVGRAGDARRQAAGRPPARRAQEAWARHCRADRRRRDGPALRGRRLAGTAQGAALGLRLTGRLRRWGVAVALHRGGRLGDLLIGQDRRPADQQRMIVLLGQRLQLDGAPHRLVEILAERDHAVAAEQAAEAILQRLDREFESSLVP